MEEKKEGCVEPATEPLTDANVYKQGGFRTLKLSDFRGKWIVLCFYPGDFTFV
ncbi:MAG: redoxin domain-containing protein [Desulfuromonadales bacterium]|nr:redoxin domain-containing protein [Desulfuromonadales bacterium]